jgi:iron donor protein CyaY
MTDQEFQQRCDAAMKDLYQALIQASDRHEFDVDFNAGAMKLEFEDPPGKMVVSPNAPVFQIWVSAHVKSFKLDWNAGRSEFVLPETGQSLKQLMAGHVSTQLGTTIEL